MMLRQVNRWLTRLVPWRCVLCGGKASARDLCDGCLADLPWIGRACRSCGLLLPPGYPDECCANCPQGAGLVDHMLAALVYEYPVDRLIAGAKYQGLLPYARLLGELLALAVRREHRAGLLVMPDFLIPVPLHPRRLGRRGFNQAWAIAVQAATLLGLTVESRCCRRTRDTPPQAALAGAARRRNLAGAFACSSQLAGRRVAIVDDVVTTGSTAESLARSLRSAGVVSVQVWSVARARPDTPLGR